MTEADWGNYPLPKFRIPEAVIDDFCYVDEENMTTLRTTIAGIADSLDKDVAFNKRVIAESCDPASEKWDYRRRLSSVLAEISSRLREALNGTSVE